LEVIKGANPKKIFGTVENHILSDPSNKQIVNFFTELMK
jgi:hypothetical protein